MLPPHHVPKQAALPMHLALAMMPWFASSAVSRLSSGELQALKQSLALKNPGGNELQRLWQNLLDDPKLAKAAEIEARGRVIQFLEGLIHYQKNNYQRQEEEFSCVLERGSARLLDCGGEVGEPAVLLVPSLINRYYVLDLTRKQSLARFLKGRGFHVFMVDWGCPSEVEKSFNCGMYVAEHLSPMAEYIKQTTKTPLVAAGYCMGGLLTLALACCRPDLVNALACFATPWDFSVPEFPKVALPEPSLAVVQRYIEASDMVPAETIHTLFNLAHPYAFQSKLREFTQLKPESSALEDFLAIEHWVQDGVPMTQGVARDCLIEWSQRNSTANLQWRACGRVIDPSTLRMPVFIAAPRDDKIVPTSCALPLANLCKKVTLVQPTSGHVGMIVGKNRRTALWEPFAEWMTEQVDGQVA